MEIEGWLADGGETGRLIREKDWSTTLLGPPGRWPEALRALVSVMLNANQPMFLAWGPDRRMIYNDAYAEIMQDRHPAAIGRPFDEVWADILDVVGPIMDRGYAGEPSYSEDLELWMIRDGVPTETHFAFSYSPIRARVGEVSGVYCSCIETTRRVMAERARQAEEDQHRATSELVSLALDNGAVIGAWGWDIKANILRSDARLAAVFGVPAKEAAEGLPLETFTRAIHPDDRDRVTREIDAVVTRPGRFQSEYRVLGSDGAYRWVSATGKVTTDDEGRAHRFPGVIVDIEDRRRMEDELRSTIAQRTLLAHELDHRVKNILAIVNALAHQTLRLPATLEQARDQFSERIRALAKAQDILTKTSWSAADVRDVVGNAVPQALKMRFDTEGPSVILTGKAILALALAMHELMTNAIKYGALSNDWGRVTVTWSWPGSTDDPCFLLRWIETGGPEVEPPQRTGFGSRLITRALADEFKGEAEIQYPREGIVFTLRAPYSPVEGA